MQRRRRAVRAAESSGRTAGSTTRTPRSSSRRSWRWRGRGSTSRSRSRDRASARPTDSCAPLLGRSGTGSCTATSLRRAPSTRRCWRALTSPCRPRSNEFFGLAMVEACYAGATPLVPDRLAYPELYGPEYRYAGADELVARLRGLIQHRPAPYGARGLAERFTFERLVAEYGRASPRSPAPEPCSGSAGRARGHDHGNDYSTPTLVGQSQLAICAAMPSSSMWSRSTAPIARKTSTTRGLRARPATSA